MRFLNVHFDKYRYFNYNAYTVGKHTSIIQLYIINFTKTLKSRLYMNTQ